MVIKRALKIIGLTIVPAVLAVMFTYGTVPTHSSDRTHFDTLIVLGCPADPDGTPSTEQRERVMKAVLEFRAGRADHIIMSGTAAQNQWVESRIMAELAEAAGVSPQAVFTEERSRNTIENIFYSNELMQQHRWASAEVVSSPSYLPRAGLILGHYKFAWRTVAAVWPPEYSAMRKARYYLREAVGTTVLRWFGFRRSMFLPES